jgi:hypothetical protein
MPFANQKILRCPIELALSSSFSIGFPNFLRGEPKPIAKAFELDTEKPPHLTCGIPFE